MKLLVLACLGSGCVLAESPESFPFDPLIVINTGDVGRNNSTTILPDVPPLPPPRLVFTEILIDAPGSDSFVVERGEYVEIKNIGEGPADPRFITLILTDLTQAEVPKRVEVGIPFTPEERVAFDALRPIAPGAYFVFVRYETPDVPISEFVAEGAFYDYGRHARGPTLPHSVASEYQLELGYRFPDGDSSTFDVIRWDGRNFVTPDHDGAAVEYNEGMALAVDSDSEDPALNDDPKVWCVPPTLVGTANGNPGDPASCP